MGKLADLFATAYEALCLMLNSLRSPLLLAIRLYWGWQFWTDGWGKLTHLDKVAGFFTSLGLPAAFVAGNSAAGAQAPEFARTGDLVSGYASPE